MRELRSAVNALCLFVLFLFAYAFFSPGRAAGSAHGPRFLRMTIDDQEGRHGRPEHVSFSVPYGFIRGGLRFASLGRLHRELDLRFTEPVEAEEVRAIWKELQETPDGGEVVRKRDDDEVRIRKEGTSLKIVQTKNCCPDEVVTLRIPLKILEAVAAHDRTFDVDALLAGLQSLDRGELLDLSVRDAHVRVWIE